jgi:hypothetical protein
MASLEKEHSRNREKLEASKQRLGKSAPGIIRETIGEIRRGDSVSEHGRRIDIGFAEILADNPSIMRRAQVMRRGRVGESNLARDMATEGWMKLAKG